MKIGLPLACMSQDQKLLLAGIQFTVVSCLTAIIGTEPAAASFWGVLSIIFFILGVALFSIGFID